ncbi:hypothetical protein [uncultured Desulfovibrio sp.]|uniref:hypothetical protein n=1 Tax=uncultured Desulfovibrio sp. TaxID=167968 RepID=UPI0026150F79|nr:hypothetical protein [uncultured Desulfovibrio sp.]
MPTVISAQKWNYDPQRIETGFQQNHGQDMSTAGILASMKELDARPEMDELFRLLRESSQYSEGKANDA